MDTTPLCPSCGKPLAASAPKGFCQECLLKAAFPTGTETGGKAPPFNPPAVVELSEKFPQLEVIELIGTGGMGAVFKARQKELDRIVALKILPPGIGRDAAFADRFAREARVLARLNHSNVVTLYEFGRADDILKEKRAEYGAEIVATLSRQLEAEFGRGFAEKNLRWMVQFAEAFPEERIVATLRRQLGWSHFKEIIPQEDELKRDFVSDSFRILTRCRNPSQRF